MKRFYLFLIVFIGLFCKAQVIGIVVNEFGEPIENVNIFWQGTSIATKSDSNGKFSIAEVNYPVLLVFQKTDYETLIIKKENISNIAKYVMKAPINLPEITYEAISDSDKKYYRILFVSNLLGETKNAKRCKIKNLESVKFSFDKSTQTLLAFSPENLEIDNPALGYKIFYELTDFKLNLRSNKLFSAGIIQFVNYKRSYKRRYQKNRKIAYLGSLQHFIKSLYEGTLAENKWEVRRIIEKPNPNYVSREEWLKSLPKKDGIPIYSHNDINNMDKTIRYIVKDLLQSKDIIKREGNDVYLSIKDILSIDYLGEKESDEYVKRKPYGKQFKLNQNSELWTEGVVKIYKNGHFSPPQNLWTSGYFAFEKLADMLPYDYEYNP